MEVLVLVDVLVEVKVGVGAIGDGLTRVGVKEGVRVAVGDKDGVTVVVGAVVDVVDCVGRGVGVRITGGGASREVGVMVGVGAPISTCGGISGGWYWVYPGLLFGNGILNAIKTSAARRKALAQAHFAAGLSVTGRPRSRLGCCIVGKGSPARTLNRLK